MKGWRKIAESIVRDSKRVRGKREREEWLINMIAASLMSAVAGTEDRLKAEGKAPVRGGDA